MKRDINKSKHIFIVQYKSKNSVWHNYDWENTKQEAIGAVNWYNKRASAGSKYRVLGYEFKEIVKIKAIPKPKKKTKETL